MNQSHYPSFELCKKLTEIGFPETELRIAETPENGSGCLCPSIMEMLDVIPKKIDHASFLIQFLTTPGEKVTGMWGNHYIIPGKHARIYSDTLPNYLATLIIWLYENNYISFTK